MDIGGVDGDACIAVGVEGADSDAAIAARVDKAFAGDRHGAVARARIDADAFITQGGDVVGVDIAAIDGTGENAPALRAFGRHRAGAGDVHAAARARGGDAVGRV